MPLQVAIARLARARADGHAEPRLLLNARKGGRLPLEAAMWPRATPKEPHFVQVRFAGRLNEAQRDYVRDFLGVRVEL